VNILTLKEYIRFLEKIQPQLTKAIEPDILKPIINTQAQLEQLFKPLNAFQNAITHSIEPLYLVLEQFRNINLAFNQYISPHIADLIRVQQRIIKSIQIINLNLSSIETSVETALKITQASLNIVNEPIIDEVLPEELNKELNKPKGDILELSKQKKPLTWEQIMNIIIFIITIISFIQAQISAKQLTNIEDSLHNIERSFQQLIEIQEEELNLLKQSQK